MDFIRSWVRNLVLIILLAHFIELMLPDSELQKYVKVVVSFFIIAAILGPLLKIGGQEIPGINLATTAIEMPDFKEILAEGEHLREINQEEARKKYGTQIEEKIKALVKLNSEIIEVEVEASLGDNDRLKEVSIEGIKKIQTPATSSEEEEKNLEVGQSIEEREERLEEIVATFYQLDSSQVEVNLKREGDS